MKKRLPIGIDDFRKIVEEHYFLIDKTLLIKELIDRGSAVFILPRPRRFGKTLNMHMIQCFFEIPIACSYNPHAEPLAYLFQDKKIWQYENICVKQGKFPVIAITLKDVRATSWAMCYEKIIDLIATEYRRHNYLANSSVLDEFQQEIFKKIIAKTASEADYQNSLKHLASYLQNYWIKELTKQAGSNQIIKVIVLIDEYDAAIHSGYLNGFYNESVGFMRGLLCGVFKDNSAVVEFGVVTGILRTAKEGIFSGLNNLAVDSILDATFIEYFGFTQHEIDTMLEQYNMSRYGDDVKRWYDGYKTSKIDQTTNEPIHLYNPWSVLNFVDRNGKFASYWANTSGNELIKKLLASASTPMQKKLESMLTNTPIAEPIDEGLVFPGMEKEENAIWSLFVFSGYLTAQQVPQPPVPKDAFYTLPKNYNISIPNLEVRELYKTLLQSIFASTTSSEKALNLLNAILSGDVEEFGELLQKFVIQAISSFDIPEDDIERSYHLLILGMIAHLEHTHQVLSNRESGSGRYDVMVIPRDTTKLGVVLEFKKTKGKETIEQAADNALAQIHEKKYATEMRARGIATIIAYGIGLAGKMVLVKAETL